MLFPAESGVYPSGLAPSQLSRGCGPPGDQIHSKKHLWVLVQPTQVSTSPRPPKQSLAVISGSLQRSPGRSLLPCPPPPSQRTRRPKLQALGGLVASPHLPASEHTVLCTEEGRALSPIPCHVCTWLAPGPCRAPPGDPSLCLELLQGSLRRAQAKATRQISCCPHSFPHSDCSGRSTHLHANPLVQISVSPPTHTHTHGTGHRGSAQLRFQPA